MEKLVDSSPPLSTSSPGIDAAQKGWSDSPAPSATSTSLPPSGDPPASPASLLSNTPPSSLPSSTSAAAPSLSSQVANKPGPTMASSSLKTSNQVYGDDVSSEHGVGASSLQNGKTLPPNCVPNNQEGGGEGLNSQPKEVVDSNEVSTLKLPALKISFYEILMRQLYDDGFEEISSLLQKMLNLERNEKVQSEFLFKIYKKYMFSHTRSSFSEEYSGSLAEEENWMIDWKPVSVRTPYGEYFKGSSAKATFKGVDKKAEGLDFVLNYSKFRAVENDADFGDIYSSSFIDPSLKSDPRVESFDRIEGIPPPLTTAVRCEMLHLTQCNTVAASNKLYFIASGAADGKLCVMNISSLVRAAPPQKEGKEGGTSSIASSSEASVPHRCCVIFDAHKESINAVCFHPWRPFCFSGSSDCSVKIYDVLQSKATAYYDAVGVLNDSVPIQCMSVHPCGDFLYVGTEQPVIKIYDLQTFKCYRTLSLSSFHKKGINDIRCSVDGSVYVSASEDGTVKLWDAVSSKIINTLESAHCNYPVKTVRWSLSGRYLLTSGLDGHARVWDVRTGKEMLSMGVGSKSIKSCSAVFLWNENYIATSCAFDHNPVGPFNEVEIYHSYSGCRVRMSPSVHTSGGSVNSLEALDNEMSLLTACSDHRSRLIDLTLSKC